MGTVPEKARVVARHGGLVGRTLLVSSLTLLSRILGFAREAVMAAVFGDASAVSDAFFTAWRVPNLFRRLLGEGALSTSLQAAITEEDADRGDEAGRRLFLGTVRASTLLLVLVTVAATAFLLWTPDRMPVTGWAWMGGDPGPVRDLAVRLLPYVLLVCLAALFGGALFVRGHYLVPSLAPAVMNTVWIVVLVAIGAAYGWSASAEGGHAEVLARQWEMARWLAWGVLLAGVVQLLLHVPPLLSEGLLVRDRSSAEASPGRGAWDVIRGAAPLALGAAVYQVNVMVDGLMAEGMLTDGGPTALYYANRVQQFPLALVATAATASVFPLLKAHGHRRELEPMRRLHDRAQLGVLFLALPATAGLLALAHPISSVLFERGSYGPEGTARVAAGLMGLALALVPAGAVGLLGRTYIAGGDLVTPVRVSMAMVGVNVLLNLLFVRVLELDVAGFTLATAVTSWGNLAVLALLLVPRLGLPRGEGVLWRGLPRRALPAVLCGLAAFGAHAGAEGLGRALALVVAIVAGVLAFALSARALRVPELDELVARLARRKG